MHSLKANIINQEQQRLQREKQMLMGANAPNIGLSQTLSGTASTQSLFSKNPKLMGGVNPLAESHKNITIKKILHEMERDLGQVEEENYQILKE
jgi:hypothetical protein